MVVLSVPTEVDDSEHDQEEKWRTDERKVAFGTTPCHVCECLFISEIRVRHAPQGPSTVYDIENKNRVQYQWLFFTGEHHQEAHLKHDLEMKIKAA